MVYLRVRLTSRAWLSLYLSGCVHARICLFITMRVAICVCLLFYEISNLAVWARRRRKTESSTRRSHERTRAKQSHAKRFRIVHSNLTFFTLFFFRQKQSSVFKGKNGEREKLHGQQDFRLWKTNRWKRRNKMKCRKKNHYIRLFSCRTLSTLIVAEISQKICSFVN